MSHKRHALKILGVAVMASLAISAFAAASASASHWTVGGSGATLTEATNVEASLKPETSAKLVGTLLGQTFELTATTLSSSGWEGTGSATIYQEGLLSKAKGRLSFSGLTVDKPSGCTVTSPIVTKNLTAELIDHTGNEHAFVKFFPEEGATFATIVVKGCAVAGSYPVKGTVYGEGNVWGTETAEQPLNFSPAINETLGGALTLGVNPATLTAEGINKLSSGAKFGAETK
jgi:hypothetical protein